MGLEHVKENILAEARGAAEQEVAQARKEAQAILARADEQAQAARAARLQDMESAVAAVKRRRVALAELEAKKLRLRAEKDLLAQVRTRAQDRLRKLPPKQNEEYLSTLVKRAGGTLAAAYARDQDKAVVERLGLRWAGALQGNAAGGVILESSDGTTREDLRYENLLDEAWRESLGDVAGALFGKR